MTPKERKEIEEAGAFVFDVPRVYASISRLAEFTGADRRTVSQRLEKAGIPSRPGPNRARLYPTDVSIMVIATTR